MEFSAVILAGGRSSRMGRDKAWLEFGKRPLIIHQLLTARRSRASGVYISAGEGACYSALGWPVLKDNLPGLGPLSGIEVALNTIEHEYLLVLAVDMPFVTPQVLRRLGAACRPGSGAVPRIKGELEPLAAFYPKAAHKYLLEFMVDGFRSARQFAQLGVQLGLLRPMDLPPAQTRLFANWNRPEDIAKSTNSLPKVKESRPRLH